MEILRIRKGFPKPEIEIFQDEDMAYLQYAPKPAQPLRDEFIGEHLVAHVDGDTDEIIAVTITNITAFLNLTQEKKYYKQHAKESVEQIVKNTKRLIEILPAEIVYRLQICT